MMPAPKATLSKAVAAATMATGLKSTGITVYDFTLGKPDFTTPTHICKAATQVVKAGHLDPLLHCAMAGEWVRLKNHGIQMNGNLRSTGTRPCLNFVERPLSSG